MTEPIPNLTFLVGEEKRLAEIISRAEIEPLLRSLIKAGPAWSAVLDEDGVPICSQGEDGLPNGTHEIRHALLVEGEPRGHLKVLTELPDDRQAEALALLARDALQMVITNNLKRMLTTELHTSVVQESYEQLVATNRSLSESEKRYRTLAQSLEQQVEERTADLRKAYARMLQQEKLAAVGSLAAGMAHEINNPNGFVRSNLATFSRYVQKMKGMIDHYQVLVANNTPLHLLQQESEKKRQELKLDYVIADTAELLAQSIEGTDRIARIVADLKSFSHVDEASAADADLNSELERTLSMLAPLIPAEACIVRNLQPLPPFSCNPGLLSQAFFNIIQNALQSRRTGLKVRISSQQADGEIVIAISDNGCGIPAGNLPRVFEPFFTTRDVGSGTGMGLTVAREIINGSGGGIEIASSEHLGTTATIRLPIVGEKG